MTHRCLIIEDDAYTAKDVRDTIASHFDNIEVLDIVDNTSAARIIIETQHPDIVISDINLKDATVFTLLREFNSIAFKIIFITSYSKYAVEAFKFSALDFLEKPFDDETLILAVQNAMSIIDQENYNKQIQAFFHNFKPNQDRKKLVLKNIEAIHIVDIQDIVYIKSDNNYSEIFINDGRKVVMSKPLKFYETQLQSYAFFRIHQSFLVNVSFAKTFHKKDSVLELSNQLQLPVSSNKTAALVQWLSQQG
ncbi:LytR/AlgR family response regulator transcription factor [Psychroserpens sp. BH13MA-6]